MVKKACSTMPRKVSCERMIDRGRSHHQEQSFASRKRTAARCSSKSVHAGSLRPGDSIVEYANRPKSLRNNRQCHSGLTRLKTLYFQGTQITDAGLKHLKRLTQLGYLNLENTKVTNAGVKDLQKALPNCKIIH